MPTIADALKNTVDTARMNAQNWKGVLRGGAKSAGLGNGQGPLGFGILGGSGLSHPLNAVQNARQKVGDVIAGRQGMRLSGTRVYVEGTEVSGGSARTFNDPIIP